MWMKTNDSKIVMGGKLTQYCRDVDLKEFWKEFVVGCDDDISWDDWQACFEEAEPEELIGITEDQLFMRDRVVFLDEGEPLCVWVDEVTDWNGNLLCYSHVGQHSSASYEYAKEQKPIEDYHDLKEELENHFGYVLNPLEEMPKLERFIISSDNFPMAIVYAENEHDAIANFVRCMGEKVLNIWK